MKKLWSSILCMLFCVAVTGTLWAGGQQEATGSPGASSANGSTKESQVTAYVPSGKLLVWSWIDKWDEKYFNQYKELNPGVEIEYMYVARADYLKKLQASISGGLPVPDIIWLNLDERKRIFDFGILDDLLKAPYNFDTNSVFSYTIAQNSDSKGRLLGIPWDIATGGIAVRNDIAQTYFGVNDLAGIELLYKDWATTLQTGKILKEKSKGEVFLFSSLDDISAITFAQNIHDLIESDGTVNLTKVFTAVYSTVVPFRDAGVVNMNRFADGSWLGSMGKGTAMTFFSPLWMVPVFEMFDGKGPVGRWTAVGAPGGAYISGGTSFGVYGKSKNKSLAWDFINWLLLSKEGAELNKKVEAKFISFKAAYDDPTYPVLTHPRFGTQDIGTKYSVDYVKDVHNLPVNDIEAGVKEIITQINVKLMTESAMTVDDAVAMMNREFSQRYPEYTYK